MIRRMILLTSLACAFQSNMQASHLQPIIDFVQRHDEISIEYKCNPQLNEESIELEGIGQSLGAYNRNGEIFIGMSMLRQGYARHGRPNGQENMWIIDEDIEEIWDFLKQIVDALTLPDYPNEQIICTKYIKITLPIENLRALVKTYATFFNWQPAV